MEIVWIIGLVFVVPPILLWISLAGALARIRSLETAGVVQRQLLDALSARLRGEAPWSAPQPAGPKW